MPFFERKMAIQSEISDVGTWRPVGVYNVTLQKANGLSVKTFESFDSKAHPPSKMAAFAENMENDIKVNLKVNLIKERCVPNYPNEDHSCRIVFRIYYKEGTGYSYEVNGIFWFVYENRKGDRAWERYLDHVFE